MLLVSCTVLSLPYVVKWLRIKFFCHWSHWKFGSWLQRGWDLFPKAQVFISLVLNMYAWADFSNVIKWETLIPIISSVEPVQCQCKLMNCQGTTFINLLITASSTEPRIRAMHREYWEVLCVREAYCIPEFLICTQRMTRNLLSTSKG